MAQHEERSPFSHFGTDFLVCPHGSRNFSLSLITRCHSKMQNSPDEGLEPSTLRLRVSCSTDWANRAIVTVKYTTLVRCPHSTAPHVACTVLQFALIFPGICSEVKLRVDVTLKMTWKLTFGLLGLLDAAVPSQLRQEHNRVSPAGKPHYRPLRPSAPPNMARAHFHEAGAVRLHGRFVMH